MSINDYGDGLVLPPPEWITEQIAFLIRRAKEDLPLDFWLQTIEYEHGLVVFVDTLMFDRYTVEQKVQIAQRINRLVEEINETGCPAWVEKS